MPVAVAGVAGQTNQENSLPCWQALFDQNRVTFLTLHESKRNIFQQSIESTHISRCANSNHQLEKSQTSMNERGALRRRRRAKDFSGRWSPVHSSSVPQPPSFDHAVGWNDFTWLLIPDPCCLFNSWHLPWTYFILDRLLLTFAER